MPHYSQDRRGFDHLTFPIGEAFEVSLGKIPTLPHPLPQGGWWDMQLI